jgi:hypothetical protein
LPYFDEIKRFRLFAAPARSGHSIMAHLLTAHPKVMICDELGAVSYFQEGYSREQVFALIKYQDYRYQRRNRRKSGYDYKVDGLWQNVYEKHPEVIGDAKGSRTTSLLGGDEHFLDLLRSKVQMPLRVLFHLRNPYDMISTKVRKRKIGVDLAVQTFIELERNMSSAYARLKEDEKVLQRHEDVIADPKHHFAKMYQFLGVEPLPKVVDALAQKLWKKPHQTRKQIRWSKREVRQVEECISQSLFFNGYQYNR